MTRRPTRPLRLKVRRPQQTDPAPNLDPLFDDVSPRYEAVALPHERFGDGFEQVEAFAR